MAQPVAHHSNRFERMLKRAGFGYLYRPVMIALIVCGLVIAGLTLWRFWPLSATDGRTFAAQESLQVTSSEPQVKTLFVDVEGAVQSPGVYELDEGARVKDAVGAAGGVASSGDTSTVNLARILSDGERLYIPTHDEVMAGAATGATTAAAAGQTLVNINTATADELCELPGVGEVTAERIVSDREQNGPFATVDDLLRVSGIGEKRFEALEGLICV